MQKISFDDRFCLTSLVLYGHKTQIRDIIEIKIPDTCLDFPDFDGWDVERKIAKFNSEKQSLVARPKYHIGEEVAVAISYKQIYYIFVEHTEYGDKFRKEYEYSEGWDDKEYIDTEKPFVKIRINNIRVERLQDIKDEDCFKEGIFVDGVNDLPVYMTEIVDYYGNIRDVSEIYNCKTSYNYHCSNRDFDTKREAFASLIDEIHGAGTWESNPFVFVYDLELVNQNT